MYRLRLTVLSSVPATIPALSVRARVVSGRETRILRRRRAIHSETPSLSQSVAHHDCPPGISRLTPVSLALPIDSPHRGESGAVCPLVRWENGDLEALRQTYATHRSVKYYKGITGIDEIQRGAWSMVRLCTATTDGGVGIARYSQRQEYFSVSRTPSETETPCHYRGSGFGGERRED